MMTHRVVFRMTKAGALVLSSLIGLVIFTACTPSGGGPTLPAPESTTSPQPAVATKSMPTPVASGMKVIYGDLQVVMNQAEITNSYLTEYGSMRVPPNGMKFLWIHIGLVNLGKSLHNLPAPEHFSVLNNSTEFKPIYGHRKDHLDYLTMTTNLVGGQAVDAWLRFDIPAALELKDLMFAFLPESTQVSVGFSASNYPAGDHPIYLWMCVP